MGSPAGALSSFHRLRHAPAGPNAIWAELKPESAHKPPVASPALAGAAPTVAAAAGPRRGGRQRRQQQPLSPPPRSAVAERELVGTPVSTSGRTGSGSSSSSSSSSGSSSNGAAAMLGSPSPRRLGATISPSALQAAREALRRNEEMWHTSLGGELLAGTRGVAQRGAWLEREGQQPLPEPLLRGSRPNPSAGPRAWHPLGIQLLSGVAGAPAARPKLQNRAGALAQQKNPSQKP